MADHGGTTYAALGIDEENTVGPGFEYASNGGVFEEATVDFGSVRAALGINEEVNGILGILMPGPTVSMRFLMRAFKTTVPTGHTYWEVFDVPDPEGLESPYPPYVLTDIVIVAEFCD